MFPRKHLRVVQAAQQLELSGPSSTREVRPVRPEPPYGTKKNAAREPLDLPVCILETPRVSKRVTPTTIPV